MSIFKRFLRRSKQQAETAKIEPPGKVVSTEEIGPEASSFERLAGMRGDVVTVASLELGSLSLVIITTRSWSKAVFVDGEFVDPLRGLKELENAVVDGRSYRAVIRSASRAEAEEFLLAAGTAVIDDPLPIIEQVVRQAILKEAARVSGWGIDSSLCGAEEVFLNKIYGRLKGAVDKGLSNELAGRKLREVAMMLPKELISVSKYPALAERVLMAVEGEEPPLLVEMRIYPSRGRLDKSQTTIAYFFIAKGRVGAYVEYYSESRVFEALKGKKALKSFASRAKDDLRSGRCEEYDAYTFVTMPPAEVATRTVRKRA